jgi:hypothetical protein
MAEQIPLVVLIQAVALVHMLLVFLGMKELAYFKCSKTFHLNLLGVLLVIIFFLLTINCIFQAPIRIIAL